MHYEVKIKSAQHAVQEAREWLGEKRFELFTTEMRKLKGRRTEKLKMLYCYASFAGIRGRAVIHGLARFIWG